MRSVNIFRTSSHSQFPIRVEFWDTDKLLTVYEVDVISEQIASEITIFISFIKR